MPPDPGVLLSATVLLARPACSSATLPTNSLPNMFLPSLTTTLSLSCTFHLPRAYLFLPCNNLGSVPRHTTANNPQSRAHTSPHCTVLFILASFCGSILRAIAADFATSTTGLATSPILWAFSIPPAKKTTIVSVLSHTRKPMSSLFVSVSHPLRHSKTSVRNGSRKSTITAPGSPASLLAPKPISVMIRPFETSCPSSVCSRSRKVMVSAWPRNWARSNTWNAVP